ncbi:MAG: haloacid dehalogenase-like hydrolase [Candidatus Delongbacteria bacterium]|nr:haloacid dehalogenase-like hydrolase [Candidatus Delongbacteria bacterium]
MISKVVFTDFDGTYIKGDSYFLSLIYLGGWKRFLKNSPALMLMIIEYYFSFITRNEAKRRSFRLIYKDMGIDDINKKLVRFKRKLHVFPSVKKKLKEFRKAGYTIVAVTASLDIYMNYFAEHFGFDGCICTETEKNGGFLTGKLKRKNCNYAEKVLRIKESQFYGTGADVIALGNSKGDKEMLDLAREFYVVDKKGKLTKDIMPW